MNRYRAALYHLSISLIVFTILILVVIFVWFPDFFFAIDGGWEGMRILIGVDLVLGPLLTLIVFKPGKPGLKLDLTLIGTFQAICLLAGLWIIYSERPVFFVFYEGHFYSNSEDTYTRYGVEAPDYRKYSDRSPARVISLPPDDPIEEADFRRVLFHENIPLWAYAKTYQPLSEHMDKVIATHTPEAELRRRDKEGHLDAWLEEHGGSFDDYAFIPIHSRYRDAFLGVRKADRVFVDIVEISPPIGPAFDE